MTEQEDISPVESSYTVVELGYTGGHVPDGKLGLGLGKPNSAISVQNSGSLTASAWMSKETAAAGLDIVKTGSR